MRHRAARATRRFAVEGSPADCVLAGLHEVMKDAPPDLVISGVNRGHNVAEDTLYSGTVGGAMEAALHGVRAVALSQYFGPPGERPRRSLRRGARARRRRCCAGCSTEPPGRRRPTGSSTTSTSRRCRGAEVRGVARHLPGLPRGRRPSGCCRHVAPNGRTFLWLTHGHGNADGPEGSDSRECHDGFITVTPLQRRPDRARPHRAACAGARIGQRVAHAPRPNSRCSSSSPCARTG